MVSQVLRQAEGRAQNNVTGKLYMNLEFADIVTHALQTSRALIGVCH
jgi:hypothetical protein